MVSVQVQIMQWDATMNKIYSGDSEKEVLLGSLRI